MRKSLAYSLCALVLVLAAGCSDDDDEPAATATSQPSTETATTTATATDHSLYGTGTASPTSTVSATPTGPVAGLWLIEVETGTRHVLYEGDDYPQSDGFSDDVDTVWVWVPEEDEFVRYDLKGNELQRSTDFLDTVVSRHRCTQPDNAVQRALIDGDEYDVNCGVFSPNGSYMVYTVNVDDPGVPQGRYGAWVLNLTTRASVLATGELRHCGGCDGRVGPAWSPSGRYVLIGETYGGPDSSMYLHDAQTSETRKVAEGTFVSGITSQVRWSPAEDAFIAPDDEGSTVIERLPDGEKLTLPQIPWPARFNEDGRLVYSPGGLYTLRPGDGIVGGIRADTAVADAGSGEVLATWEGKPATWPVERGVQWAGDGAAALLEEASACPGTTLHHPTLEEPRCLPEALGAVFDAETAHVAFARPTTEVGTATRWAIFLYDFESEAERLLGETSATFGADPPLIRWHPNGTHLLVLWPGPSGI